MRTFDRVLGKISMALAWLACAVIPVLCGLVVTDVSMRTLGANPPLWTSSVVEYALLYVTMLPAAWLVRERGHVAIEALVAALPRVLQTVLAYFVYLVCTVTSFLCAWFAFGLLAEALESGALDVRGVDMPTWMQYLPLTIGFTLVGLEFLMYLVGLRSYYSYDLGEVKDGV